MQRAKGRVSDNIIGARRCVVPTEVDIEKSDSLRDKTWRQIEAGMKGELSEETIMELKAAFYRISQKYLFLDKSK